MVFDSGHYQETANLLVSTLNPRHVALTQQVSPSNEKQDLAQALMLDGPILPGLAALSFLSLGRIFSMPDWQCLLWLQALLHGLGAALVFFTGRQFFVQPAIGSSRWALAAGLLWAVNPIAVLSSQRFLSENLAANLLLVLVLLCCRIARSIDWQVLYLSLACGLTAALILFSKTGLAPATAAILAVSAAMIVKRDIELQSATSKRPLGKLFAMLVGLILGASVMIVPWAIYTERAVGEAQYFPQRSPALNLFVGWNFETEGLSTLPVAPLPKSLQKLYEKTGSAPQTVLSLWRQEPMRCCVLALCKMTRLYGLPWNDFRRNALFFSPKMQQLLFQVVMLLAVLSACLAIGRRASLIFWLSLIAIVGHLVFLAFEAVPRYSFSSYPFLFLVALYLIQVFATLTWTGRRLVGCAIVGALLLILANFKEPLLGFMQIRHWTDPEAIFSIMAPFVVLPGALIVLSFLMPVQLKLQHLLRFRIALAAAAVFCATIWSSLVIDDFGRAEWQAKLGGGETAERVIDTKAFPRLEEPAKAFLLIDGVRQVDESEISINGQMVKHRPGNLLDYLPAGKTPDLFANQVAAFMGRSTSDIRRWWAVPLPLAALRKSGHLTIALKATASTSVRLYGEYPSQGEGDLVRRPGFLYISPGKIWTSNDSFEWREGPPFFTSPLYGKSSLIKADGSRVKQDGNWRMILVIAESDKIDRVINPVYKDGQPSPGKIYF